MLSDKYYHAKKKLLKQISAIINSELSAIDSLDKFDELLNRENVLITELTELDRKYLNIEFSESQKRSLFDLLNSINSVKKQVIDKYNEAFDNFQKRDIFLSNRRGLFNAYFQKIAINPRFIDTNK